MSEYPTWFCPVFACPYRTSYSINICKHLTEVHNWGPDRAEAEVDNFFDAHLKDAEVICSKPPSDPTVASLLFSSEAEAKRSVSSGGGAGG